jgi:hypothetical protein
MTRRFSRVFAAAVVTLALNTPAHAQATRTWVSGVGDDVNPCSRTAPCKTFAGAISKTATHGEINIIDNGGFGAVTITKSITINGEGGFASILAGGVNGIVVNSATANVTLRNLAINGIGTGLSGIRILEAANVAIQNCAIQGFTQNGVIVATNGVTKVTIEDTTIHDSVLGVLVAAKTANKNTAALRNVSLTDNNIGVRSGGASSIITLEDSFMDANLQDISNLANGIVESYGNNALRNGVPTTSLPLK